MYKKSVKKRGDTEFSSSQRMKDEKKEINEMTLNNYQRWYAELGKFPVSGHPLLRKRVEDTFCFILRMEIRKARIVKPD